MIERLHRRIESEWRSLLSIEHGEQLVPLPWGVWVRLLLAVHFEQPWSTRLYERSLPPGKSYFPIAQATLAPYMDSEDWYVDYQWGGRYGRGYRVAVDANGSVGESVELWRS